MTLTTGLTLGPREILKSIMEGVLERIFYTILIFIKHHTRNKTKDFSLVKKIIVIECGFSLNA